MKQIALMFLACFTLSLGAAAGDTPKTPGTPKAKAPANTKDCFDVCHDKRMACDAKAKGDKAALMKCTEEDVACSKACPK